MPALSIATSLRLGVYDPNAAGLSTTDATLRTLDLIRAIAHRHYANNTNAAVADWGNDWQSPLWAYYGGQAAWLMWDKLSPADRDDVARMIAFEADRLLTGSNQHSPGQRRSAGSARSMTTSGRLTCGVGRRVWSMSSRPSCSMT